MKNALNVPHFKKATFPSIVLMLFGTTFVITSVVSQASQYPLADEVAQLVIANYQTSSCADLKQQKAQPLSAQQAARRQEAMTALRNNPDLRQAFINQVAGPIANKMFECAMIP